jgi:hypothetical protein
MFIEIVLLSILFYCLDKLVKQFEETIKKQTNFKYKYTYKLKNLDEFDDDENIVL